MNYSIGIDIGGMSIKFGLVNDLGEIVYRATVKTNKDIKIAIQDIVKVVLEILENNNLSIKDIQGIGIGCPGAVDSITGKIIALPNLGWEDYDFVNEMKKYIDTKIVVSNDVNVATLGEWKFGSAQGYKDVIMLAVGTGVGSGMIVDGKLYEGGFSRGGEIGHTTLYMDGLECTCGRKGCLECYASATALINQTKEEMLVNKQTNMWDYVKGDIDNVDGRTALECSKTGDIGANKVVDKFVAYLSEGVLNCLNVFRPEVFILGGGISAQGDYLMKKIISYCKKYDYGYKNAPITKIVAAKLGNDAGIIGASCLTKDI